MMSATRVLREAGGLGDVVMSLVVAQAVKGRFPDLPLYFYCLSDYQDVVALSPAVDYFVSVSMAERRPRDVPHDPVKWPYLGDPKGIEWAMSAECWCPAFKHEKQFGHASWESRIETMLAANGLEGAPLTPHLSLPDYILGWADGWAKAHFSAGAAKMVGIQPLSRNPRRDWPIERWAELSKRLQDRGYSVIVFHSYPAPVLKIPGLKVCGVPLWQLAAITRLCRVVISPDSGMYHLSAAVDTPAIGLFGSTSAISTMRPYPLHTAIWKPDPPGHAKCRTPCYSFEWEGCGVDCRKQAAGCALLQRISVDDVLQVFEGVMGTLARRTKHAASVNLSNRWGAFGPLDSWMRQHPNSEGRVTDVRGRAVVRTAHSRDFAEGLQGGTAPGCPRWGVGHLPKVFRC